MVWPPSRDDVLGGLSSALWRERQLLELLLFRLVEEQALLQSGQDQWLPQAIRDVDDVVEQVQVAELGREVEVAVVSAELDLPRGTGDEVTLRTIIDRLDGPWDEIMDGHRRAFVELTGRINVAARRNRRSVGESPLGSGRPA